MNPSSHSLAPGSSLPDDIRLKCSYYASEIKTQVNSLCEEQHKWLEDHLSEIRDTLTKAKEKKAGTRAVMAGIIKTPSRKRNKTLLKKTSKLDHLGLDLSNLSNSFNHPNSSHPLSQLKRSHLHMQGPEIQQIIHQQFERERSDIESRLQKDLSSLENQYESPAKKSSVPSTVPLVNQVNQASLPLGKTFPPFTSPKSIRAASPSEPFPTLDRNRSPFLPLTNKPLNNSEQGPESPSPPFSPPPNSHEKSSQTNPRPDSGTSLSVEEPVDPNDTSAAAGHELSAIQEGEEDEDPNVSRLPQPTTELTIAEKSASLALPPQNNVTNPREPSPSFFTPSPPGKLPHRSTPTSPVPQLSTTSPPSRVASNDGDNASTGPQKCANALQVQPDRPTLSSGSSSVPETNSAVATGFDSDPIAPSVSSSSQAPLQKFLSDGVSKILSKSDALVFASGGTISNAIGVPSSQPLSVMPSSEIPTPASISFMGSGVPTDLCDKLPSSAVSAAGAQTNILTEIALPTSLPSKSDLIESMSAVETLSPPSPLPPPCPLTFAAPVARESTENKAHSLLRDANHLGAPAQSHVDTFVEVPLTDKPSSLRNNQFASIGSSHSTKPTDHQTRTPGDHTATNLFTPGNARAALIQSPHSQWSSKPSGPLWTQQKPLKTPATMSNFGTIAQTERPKGSFSGSPFEDLPKPFSLISNLQSTTNPLQSALPDSQTTSSLTQSTSLIDSQDTRRGLKRTSTDAGLTYAADSHEAKMSRSHAPGMTHIRSSTAGAAGRKGMEDLKSRLSKIQRESALHERVHHHAPSSTSEVPVNSNQRASLATHNNVPSLFKPLPSANPLASAAPLVKSSTLSTSVTNPSDLTDRETTTGTRGYSQASQSGFTAPIELPASIKANTVQPVTEPIKLEGLANADSSIHSNVQNINATAHSANIPPSEAMEVTLKSRSSSSTSHRDMSVSHEVENNSLAKEAPIRHLSPVQQLHKQPSVETTCLETITKIESKHLAFLKGTTCDLNPTTLRPSTLNNEPIRNLTSLTDEQLTFYDCPVALEDKDTHPDCVQRQVITTSDDIEGDDHDANVKRLDLFRINNSHSKLNPSSKDHQVDEQGDEVDEDEDPYGEPSIEVIGSNEQRVIAHDVGIVPHPSDERYSAHHSEDEHDSDQIQPHQVAQSELIQTPKNAPAAPRSPVSTAFMGVFKAGAALASSWTGSKAKPELKSLQLAAAAAKKEQDERDRKATIKEERRLLAAEKKQAEETIRTENERQARLAEVERKKQEREEALKARPPSKAKLPSNQPPPGSRQASMTGDATKKRKVENESNRAMDLKKTKAPQKVETQMTMPSSAHKGSTSSYLPMRTAPTAPGSAMKATSSKAQQVSTSTSKPTPQHHKPNQPTRPVSQILQSNGHSKAGAATTISTTQLNSSQMSTTSNLSKSNNSQLTGKGKRKEEKKVVEEEYIELPDIDSEYSDDDESEHERKEAKLPEWAQSPALREALANQRKVNPDDVFGGSIPPPRMDEIFRGKSRTSRFRHRTSSANWTGTDGLTALEEAEYAKRMGYQTKKRSIKR